MLPGPSSSPVEVVSHRFLGLGIQVAEIELSNVGVSIPVYDYSARKLFKSVRNRSVDRKTHGKQRRVDALQDISFRLRDGDRLGIIGQNGAGKSTLLRVLSGVYSPTHGTITTNGKINSLLDISFGIEPDLTGRESIALRSSLLGLSRTEVVSRLGEIISFSGLGEFIDLPTRTYSSGMFVRLAFSIATVLEPEILIMDEWLSVGDESFKAKAEQRLQALVDSTSIVVIASHSRHLIESTCNRALLLEGGRVSLDAPPKEVCSAYFDGV